MTKEEAIKVIRHMAYLSAHVVENGVEAYEYIEQFLSKPSLPSNLDDAEFEYAQSLDEIPANQEEEKMIYDAFKAGAEWRDAQIQKLSNSIDEAAEKIYPMTTTPPTQIEVAAYYNAAQQKLRDAFKAGAEWMAGQGYTKEGIARPDDCEIWVNLIGTDIKDGDKVIIQVRKKET